MEKYGEIGDIWSFILPASALAAWCAASYILNVPAYIIPTPGDVAASLVNFAAGYGLAGPYSGGLLVHSAASAGRVAHGFFLALCAGLPLGILTGSFSKARRIFDPFVHLLRMVPGIGWLPIAMVWFGVGRATAVFLISLAAFFPIYLSTSIAVRQVPEKLVQAARILGAEGPTLFVHVIIPASAAGIISGLRLGLGVSWAYVVLGELTGVSKGLGAVMMNARMLGDTSMIIVSMIVIALLGWLSDRLLLALIKRVHPSKEVLSHE